MFPIASANITGHRGRRATASTITSGAATIALLAASTTFSHAAENSSRMAQEHYACAVVMELRQPGDLYDTCIRSLDKTLSELDQARLVATDKKACALEQLKSGTPDFALCVLNAQQSLTGARRPLSQARQPDRP